MGFLSWFRILSFTRSQFSCRFFSSGVDDDGAAAGSAFDFADLEDLAAFSAGLAGAAALPSVFLLPPRVLVVVRDFWLAVDTALDFFSVVTFSFFGHSNVSRFTVPFGHL